MSKNVGDVDSWSVRFIDPNQKQVKELHEVQDLNAAIHGVMRAARTMEISIELVTLKPKFVEDKL